MYWVILRKHRRKFYIGVREGPWKQICFTHKKSFNNKNSELQHNTFYTHSEPEKIKPNTPEIIWKVIKILQTTPLNIVICAQIKTSPQSPSQKKNFKINNLEHISKCTHENKFLLSWLKTIGLVSVSFVYDSAVHHFKPLHHDDTTLKTNVSKDKIWKIDIKMIYKMR